MTLFQKQKEEAMMKAHTSVLKLVGAFATTHNLSMYEAEKRLDSIGAPDYVAAKKEFERAYTERKAAMR